MEIVQIELFIHAPIFEWSAEIREFERLINECKLMDTEKPHTDLF